MLGEDEIRHIFPDEEAEEIQAGDVVSALWLPNSQFYDAKVLQKGADKDELMRERLQLEKAKKNKEKTTKTTQDPKVQKKRKNPKDSADQQKKNKKTKDQTQRDREMQQKEKEKEEKKQKKDEEQRRQKFLLEARKAQATKRWSSTNSELTIVSPLNTSFRPEPLHQANRPSTHLASPSHQAFHPSSTSPHADHQKDHQPSADLTTQAQKAAETPARINTCAQSNGPTTPAHQTDETRTRHTQSMHPTPCTSRQIDETPVIKSTSSKNTSEPRRGLHFQSTLVMTDSSENESDEECDATDLGSNASCCKQQKLENEALRKRLQKLHKRLNIALKAKTVEEVVKNRPVAGILDTSLAVEYKMVEVMEGSGVYWYPHQRAYCSAFKNWPGYINASIDIFFNKQTLAASSAMGNEKKSKKGSTHQPLNPLIIQALLGKVCSKFNKDVPTPSQIVQKINMKCVEARRPPRTRKE